MKNLRASILLLRFVLQIEYLDPPVTTALIVAFSKYHCSSFRSDHNTGVCRISLHLLHRDIHNQYRWNSPWSSHCPIAHTVDFRYRLALPVVSSVMSANHQCDPNQLGWNTSSLVVFFFLILRYLYLLAPIADI